MTTKSAGVRQARTLRPRWAGALAAGFVMTAAAIFLCSGVKLFKQFPGSYTWTELLISYEGGFVRRGLLGELGYLIDPWIRVDYAITFVVIAAYLVVAVVTVAVVFRQPSFSGLLCLVSPGLLLFPVWDFNAFGRKDVFILLAFVLAVLAAHRIKALWAAFLTIALIYTLVALIHEAAWLYFIAAVAFLLLERGDDVPRQMMVIFATLVYVAFWALVTRAFKGSPEQVEAMIDSWRTRVPAAYPSLGAARFLVLPFEASFQMVVGHQRHLITSAGYIGAFLLTAIPVALAARTRRVALRPTPFRLLILAIGASAMLTSFAIAADWGRYSYVFWMHTLLFFLSLRGPIRGRAKLPRPAVVTAAMVLLIVYATSWHVLHFAEGGKNPLERGLLLSVLLLPP